MAKRKPTLRETIKRLREAKGWTQGELAHEASKGLKGSRKVSRVYVTQLETGAKKNPSLITLSHLAKALGVPVDRLLKCNS